MNNLKNVDVKIPREELVVITGLSGSGKSSLAFDTIFAEGHRRYVENLSSYARQFLNVSTKPDIDKIENLSPVIAINQTSVNRSPRSTVGTMTEIYDYLRILFSKIGKPHCPKCQKVLNQKGTDEIADEVIEYGRNRKGQVILLARPQRIEKDLQQILLEFSQLGYARARINRKIVSIKDIQNDAGEYAACGEVELVVDRINIDRNFNDRERLIDSIETAIKLGRGEVIISCENDPEDRKYNRYLVCPDCDVTIEEISPSLFSFNNPEGACPDCTGLGTKLEVEVEQVIPNKKLTLREGAIRPWNNLGARAAGQNGHLQLLKDLSKKYKFSLDKPVKNLKPEAMKVILYGGDENFSGVIPTLERKYKETHSEYLRSEIEKYMVIKTCPVCNGKRLAPVALSVLIDGKSIDDLSQMSLEDLQTEMEAINENAKRTKSNESLIGEVHGEIEKIIKNLCDAGLSYLTLSRSAGSLSGGEAQRIRLATQIGSGLVGILYVLDEPSIGLHERDTQKLIGSLKKLKDEGNSIIVVEHDGQIIKSADWLIDMGPGAGDEGGEITFEGEPKKILTSKSLTGKYLSRKLKVSKKTAYRKGNGKNLSVIGATENNLKHVNVNFPLGKLVSVAGVSGSGKSTLVQDILSKALRRHFFRSRNIPGKHEEIKGIGNVSKVVSIDQSPIGRTPRSNAATYTGLFSLIRDIFADTEEARKRGYTASRFSFNMKGGRCEVCQGEGFKKIEMQLLPDIYVPCEACHGTRYNHKTLEIEYRGENIAQVLDMSVGYALRFFSNFPLVFEKLKTLEEVGLGYLKLGQSAMNLSGGEAQRIKLATELARRTDGKALYILDEPTIGLHFEDIAKLLKILDGLVDKGNTVLVVEHNLDVIKASDWVVELGPEGGKNGGEIVFEGTPKKLAKAETWTAKYL